MKIIWPKKLIKSLIPLVLIVYLLIGSKILLKSLSSEFPVIDGIITEEEWEGGDRRILQMADGTTIDVTIKFNLSHIFILIQVSDDDPKLFGESGGHDFFGVEFDNNGDKVPMGLSFSPDDALFVSYNQPGGEDFFLQGMGNPAVADILENGTNDGKGSIKLNPSGDGLIMEGTKPLDSNDSPGYDVSLHPGDRFNLMFAYWDNHFGPLIQSTSHSDWTTYEVPGQPQVNIWESELILEIVYSIGILVLMLLARFALKRP
ncbi:MAG: hypothetical protein ACFFE8_05690 [Candidatus Heimdallarchaeota archaeon]